MGMLSWKENEKASKNRAPLILLPVRLERSSAKSDIKIHQIKDEEPIVDIDLEIITSENVYNALNITSKLVYNQRSKNNRI